MPNSISPNKHVMRLTLRIKMQLLVEIPYLAPFDHVSANRIAALLAKAKSMAAHPPRSGRIRADDFLLEGPVLSTTQWLQNKKLVKDNVAEQILVPAEIGSRLLC